MKIQVQQQDFDFNQLHSYLNRRSSSIGAIATFCGLVRDIHHISEQHEPSVIALELEHYPGMTEDCLQQIANQASERWQLNDVIILHRVGKLLAGDNIVFVATAAAHRKDAFAACQFIMDILKTSAPFWKKEHTLKGQRWLEAKESDQLASQQWQASATST